MALSIPALVGSIVAGGVAFVVLTYVLATSWLWRRHKRQIADMERQILASRLRYAPECSDITRPSISLRRSPQGPLRSSTGWGPLSSNEDLRENRLKRANSSRETRKSFDLPLWPLPRKVSKRGVPTKRIRTIRLSTVVESPKTDTFCLRSIESTQPTTTKPMNEKTPLEDTPSTPNGPSLAEAPGQSPSRSPLPAIYPPEALRAADLKFSKRASDIFATSGERQTIDRSISVPTILAPWEGATSAETQQQAKSHVRNSRSFSVGHVSAAPLGPLPPLPETTPSGRNLSVPSRRISNDSMNTTESTDSSCLFKIALTPVMIDRNAFSETHPAVDILLQDHQRTTDTKDTLVAGPRQAQVASQIRDSPRMVSSRASLFVNDQNRQDINEASAHFSHNSQPISDFQQSTPVGGEFSRPLSTMRTSDNPIGVLSTPKHRNAQTRKVSDSYGSPIERPKRHSSALRRISGNSAMPSRDNSQASMQSNDSNSTNGNPFVWDTNTPPVKPSVLKGSPNARKCHRRQNCVRILLTPTVLGPPSRSSSRPDLLDIAEEAADDHAILPTTPLVEVHPPRASTFEPRLSLASCGTSSSRESQAAALDEDEIHRDLAAYHRGDKQALGNRQSTASSILLIPMFPSRSPTSIATHTAGESKQPEESPMYLAPKPLPIPNRRSIPGLTLLEETHHAKLQYPMIDLMSSTSCMTCETASIPGTASTPAPLEDLDGQRTISPIMPRTLSPPTKGSATTQVSRTSTSVKPSNRPTPLTSINPLRTKPDFSPAPPMPHIHPVGPRAPPAPSLLKSVKSLRRDNSEAFHSDTHSARHYLSLGRHDFSRAVSSPHEQGNNKQLYSNPIFVEIDLNDKSDEKENMLQPRPNGPAWDDGEPQWGNVQDDWEGEERENLVETPRMALKKSKRVTRDGVDHYNTPTLEVPVGSETPKSLYDENGFLVLGDDSP